ncbi:ATP-dependent DNA helicase RecG [Thermosulfurimonas sp. F29]|uniref:ATP-dependent DNA helicase RecG n=1 Tax=Thermosulfurimonas sp. F29 TaxID=2867247 RepID=UPI001C84047F|nr:ATP-dependent DNA helicase RecG [Thermosulfurimonas sp. F29]MBX6422442.1 ATP-dependent DNA helicase RecG [Thermosulfurimonas sp. F29]
MRERLEEWRERFRRPLLFCARRDFALLPKVRDLELTLTRLLEEAPEELSEALRRRLGELVRGIDSLEPEEKKERIKRILELSEDLAGPEPEEEFPAYPDPDLLKRFREELRTPVQFLRGVGPKLAARLATRGIHTIEDLLYFLPKSYEDRRRYTPIRELRAGGKAVVKGEVVLSGPVQFRRRRIYEVVLSDGTGLLTLKWFHFRESHLRETFRIGKTVIVSGEVSRFGGRFEMVHPEVEDPEAPGLELHVGRILPVYPPVEGVSPKVLRRIVREAVERHADKLVSYIPPEILRRRRLLPLSEAVRGLHFPPDDADLSALNAERSVYHKSLAFDEFFFLELALGLRRSRVKQAPGIAFRTASALVERFLARLPFRLTRAQERAFEEIKRDMAKPFPMNRLLQGDVGCGKTVVAFLAALIAIDNGYQVALMAPTEILAEQHYAGFRELCGLAGVETALLTGGLPPSRKREVKQALALGQVHLVIGTHALFQEDVEFKRLGLVVIDEQHRFGVLQRAALRDKAKGVSPDTLVMTATPIPRTLALTIYGDLEVSLIDELPAGRKPVRTELFTEASRHLAYEKARQEARRGHRVYVVLPLIEESEKMDLLSATEWAEHLRKEVFSEFRVGLLHGRMSPPEKERVMRAFKRGDYQILVSTTVIEVGVDVPEATVMIIEHAERFGLSQLHQLRGRVGRSDRQSYCFLVAHGVSPGGEAWRRLRVLTETNDGFRIAEEDLKIRGPGEFLGTRQHGYLEFRRADLVRDYEMLLAAREEAFRLLEEDPALARPEHQPLKEILSERWAERLRLSEVA